MKTRLRPVLPLVEGEAPVSYASRLATFHAVGSARTLCLETGLRFQGLVNGDEDQVARLANLAEVSAADLEANALRRDADGFSLRGERMVRSTLRRARVYVCPRCLSGDAAASEAPADAAMAGRSVWLLEPLRTCAVHGVALIGIATAGSAHNVHDFALMVAPMAHEVARLAAEAVERALTGLEHYLLSRLDGVRGTAPWLDTLPWHAAARTCEMLGAVATLGRTPNLNLLDDDAWQRAGGAGFALARDGEIGVRAFLSDLQRTFPSTGSGTERAQAMFGRFYQWLAFGAAHPAYEPVRDLVFRHLHETTPVGPDDMEFGRRFPDRRIHSVRTAALETGAHPKRLRKVLVAAGLVGPQHAGKVDAETLFDADNARPMLDKLRESITLKEAQTYLNAGRVQTKLLADHGLIRPAVTAGDSGIGWHGFARADLDAFLESLLRRAVPVRTIHGNLADIPGAAKRANCGAAEIVRLIQDGKLAFVGRVQGSSGYLSVLVNVEEVKAHVHRVPLDGLTREAVAKRLGTRHSVVVALCAAGMFTLRRAVNPMNRCPVEIIDLAEVQAFEKAYVHLHWLARERGEHFRQVKARLERTGIHPAFDPDETGATYYRRADAV